MKLMRSAAAVAIAKRVYEEARKPHNQAKIKDFVAQMQAKRKGSAPGRTKPKTY